MSDDFDISQIIEDEESDQPTIEIITPGGASFRVLNQEEADHYIATAQKYQDDNKFTNASDIAELDRILMMELMCYRWSQWLLQEEDYYGKKVNPVELQKSVETYSKEIRGIKKDLGIDKSTRDRGGAESVADYIQKLQLRAKEFGYTRNKQAVKAITILMELRGLITLHKNSSDSERREFEARWPDIVAWFEEKCEEFDEIDAQLREKQTYWVREL